MTATVKVVISDDGGSDIAITGEDHQVYAALTNPDIGALLAKIRQTAAEFAGVTAVVNVLGGTPVEQESGTVGPPWQTESNEGEDLWDQAAKARGSQEAKPAADPVEELRALIDSATSVDEIKDVWATHSDAIKANGLVDHWQTQGKALKSAANQ